MRRKPASSSGCSPVSRSAPWLRKHAFAVRLAGCFLLVALATVFVGFAPETNLIWVANGVLLAFLLLAARRRWAAYLAAGFAAQFAGGILVEPHWQTNLVLTVLNLIEVLICALLLRRRSVVPLRFTDPAYLLRFFAYGVLAGPLIAGVFYALFSAHWLHKDPLAAFLQWSAADTLGIAIATPACVAIFQTGFRSTASWRRHAICLGLFAAVTVASFAQGKLPLIFLVYPLLGLVLFFLGLSWAALGALFIAAVGSWYTIHNLGPFAWMRSASPIEPSILLQLFVAFGMLFIFAASVIIENQKATARRLQEIVALHNLVTENSRDAILIVDFDGYASYVSPAMERMIGWSPEEMREQGGGQGIVHPEDQAEIHRAVSELRAGAEGAMTEYRVRKRNGHYIWVEASLKTLRDPVTGISSGTLNIVRDISERKLAEKQLQDAYNAVEALAATDTLTGLANRRRFDQVFADEWRRGLRDRKPISLLMIDADLFKAYNDTYGHPRGDRCLKQIAEAALDVVVRPGDLVARFGGEEFAVVLPNTDSEGAIQVANEICEALRSRRLPHPGSPLGIMTLSAGCATLVPSFGQHSANLIELADEALYKAKRSGRNQVCSGNASNPAAGQPEDNRLSEATVARTA
ncbi:MAG TPA: diguanylate cyclase [Terracidiphilus sp.]